MKVMAILLFAFAVRTIELFAGGKWENPLLGEPTEEVVLARKLALGIGYVTPFDFQDPLSGRYPSAHSPPGYPFMLAGLIRGMRAFSSDPVAPYRAALLLGSLVGAIAVALAALTAGKVFGISGFFFVGALCSVWPTMVRGSGMLWDTPFSMLAVTGAALLAVSELEHRNAGTYALLGMAGGCSTLFNPMVAPLFGASIVSCAGRRRPLRRAAGLISVALAVWLISVSPWLIRNACVFGRFIPIRNNLGLELWIGNLPACDGTSRSACERHPMNNSAERNNLLQIGEDCYMQSRMDKALETIRGNPWVFLSKTLRRLRLYWLGDYKRPTVLLGFRIPSPGGINPAKPAINLLLMAMGALGLCAWKPTRGRWVIAFGVLYLPLTYYFTHVSPNYRTLVDPLICIAAGGWMALQAQKLKMWKHSGSDAEQA